MNNEMIILQRKQPIPYTIVYPYGEDGRDKLYKFAGTIGMNIAERAVPKYVFEWLVNETTAISEGDLIVKPTETEKDEEIKYTLENIPSLKDAEESVFTQNEIKEILEKGNHNSLKKKLNELIEGKDEKLVKIIKKQVINVATEVGIDSGSKRKVLCDWADLDYEMSDSMFDKM